jgi:hypothetical protein
VAFQNDEGERYTFSDWRKCIYMTKMWKQRDSYVCIQKKETNQTLVVLNVYSIKIVGKVNFKMYGD